MQDCDIKFIKQIKNNKNLCDYLSHECSVDFVEDDILYDNFKTLLIGCKCNYNMEPFACDGSGGVFVLLNQILIGYLDSEGHADIIANNIKDFFAIILNCGHVSDWAKFDWLIDEDTFTKTYQNLKLARNTACVKLFIKENGLKNESVEIYNIFKKSISIQPQLMIKANIDGYEDYEQLFTWSSKSTLLNNCDIPE